MKETINKSKNKNTPKRRFFIESRIYKLIHVKSKTKL